MAGTGKALREGERRGAHSRLDVWSLLETTLGAEEGLRLDQGCSSPAHSQSHLTVTSHLCFFVSASPLTHTAAPFSRSLLSPSSATAVASPCSQGHAQSCTFYAAIRIAVITSEFCSYISSLKNSYYLFILYRIKCTFLEVGLHSNSD